MQTTNQIASDLLASRIATMQQQLASQVPPDVITKLGAEITALAGSSAGSDAPKVGGKAPDFALTDISGASFRLSDQLRKGPVAVVFYRGQWCPYCDLQLRSYQEIMPQVHDLGGQIIAISPQTVEASKATAADRKLSFPVAADPGNKVARQYGLVFKMSEGMQAILKGFQIDIPSMNGDASQELPVPATFVVGRDGIIKTAFCDANYTVRLEPQALLESLRSLATQ